MRATAAAGERRRHRGGEMFPSENNSKIAVRVRGCRPTYRTREAKKFGAKAEKNQANENEVVGPQRRPHLKPTQKKENKRKKLFSVSTKLQARM